MKIFIITFISLISLVYSRSSCNCNRMYKPVCGSDGNIYGNECVMECSGATKAEDGLCDKVKEKINDCSLCPRNYNPVCSVDYRIFPNRCLLECNPNAKLLHEGECKYRRNIGSKSRKNSKIDKIKKQLKANDCHCTFEYEPVCSVDGRIFANKCQLKCHNAELAHEGECKYRRNTGSKSRKNSIIDKMKKELMANDCHCTLEYEPVCSVDGLIYANKCELKCHNAELLHEGECIYDRNSLSNLELEKNIIKSEIEKAHINNLFKKRSTCDCPRNYEPFCSTTGKSYSNRCLLECANEKIQNKGECLSLTDDIETCHSQCDYKYEPICGTNGKTYSNICEAKCFHATPAHKGFCKRKDCNCPRNFKPKCGTDGWTYNNECEAECNDVKVKHSGNCDCVVTLDFNPVCTYTGQTYSNYAEAKCNFAVIKNEGEC